MISFYFLSTLYGIHRRGLQNLHDGAFALIKHLKLQRGNTGQTIIGTDIVFFQRRQFPVNSEN
jgi:hypothetical protein